MLVFDVPPRCTQGDGGTPTKFGSAAAPNLRDWPCLVGEVCGWQSGFSVSLVLIRLWSTYVWRCCDDA